MPGARPAPSLSTGPGPRPGTCRLRVMSWYFSCGPDAVSMAAGRDATALRTARAARRASPTARRLHQPRSALAGVSLTSLPPSESRAARGPRSANPGRAGPRSANQEGAGRVRLHVPLRWRRVGPLVRYGTFPGCQRTLRLGTALWGWGTAVKEAPPAR